VLDQLKIQTTISFSKCTILKKWQLNTMKKIFTKALSSIFHPQTKDQMFLTDSIKIQNSIQKEEKHWFKIEWMNLKLKVDVEVVKV